MPRELFYRQLQLEEGLLQPERPRLVPRTGLDDYVYSLEIMLFPTGSNQFSDCESIFVGTGSPSERFYRQTGEHEQRGNIAGSAHIEFFPPAEVYQQAESMWRDHDMETCIRVFVTRSDGKQARLCHGPAVDDFSIFYNMGSLRQERAASPQPMKFFTQTVDFEARPEISAYWEDRNSRGGAPFPSSLSVFTVKFSLAHDDHDIYMSIADTCLALEHYVDWI